MRPTLINVDFRDFEHESSTRRRRDEINRTWDAAVCRRPRDQKCRATLMSAMSGKRTFAILFVERRHTDRVSQGCPPSAGANPELGIKPACERGWRCVSEL